MSRSLFRTKPLHVLLGDTTVEGHRLRKTLGPWDLVALGIGCIIGVGIFVLPGTEAANHAGPGIILSFAVAALACACSALCYAELASMIPVAGSAYTYGYTTLGELPGWIIGWDLILEYMVAACLVSIGWSAYLANLINNLLAPWGVALPGAFSNAPLAWDEATHQFVATGAVMNLPAVFIIALLTALLVRGIKESSRVNQVIVAAKIVVILFFILLTVWYVKPGNWQPFMPFGFSGVMTSAAIVFLAYVGFDAVSTAAEEAVNPQKDMPFGIIGSLTVATVLYIAVSAIMTGVIPYTKLGVADPVALVLNELKLPWASMIVSLGAIAGITSVLLVLLLGQPRILFAMSRDGLLPEHLSRVHPRFQTPHLTTIATGIVVAVGAALFPIRVVAELCSIGTLFAFIIVCAGVIILRRTRPEMERPFRTPAGWPTAIVITVLVLLVNALVPWPETARAAAAAAGDAPQFGAATSVFGRLLWPIDVAVWAVHRAEGFAVHLWALLPWFIRPIVIVGVFLGLLRRVLLPSMGILLCGYLMLSLPRTAWERFLIWLLIGLVIYFCYGRRKSRLAAPDSAATTATGSI